jgi:predicted RNA binding protein YcfA (HicA-like mRNA interferase family)
MMSEQLDLDTRFTGAHPTNKEFIDQLRSWGFTQRRVAGVHLALRGPRGGTVRILRVSFEG